MIAIAVCDDEVSPPVTQVDRDNRSLQIVIWMYEHYRDGVLALRRWRADNQLKTNGVTRTAFEAARRHFNSLGDTALLDLANIGRVVEQRVDLHTGELNRVPYAG